jgi:hypothetical protein
MISKRFGFGAVALTALSFLATPAAAQLCTGVPMNVGQTNASLRAWMPEGSNTFELRGANKLAETVTIGATYSLTTADGLDALHSLGVDGALELPLNLPVGVCAVAGVSTNVNGDGRLIDVPLGVAFGGNLEVGDGLSLVPFAIPQLMYTRISGGGVSISNSDFGILGGANLIVNNLAFGFQVRRPFVDGAKTDFGVLIGMNF